jgi:4-hydroxybenzoate polyprenyltransferase
MRLYDTYLGKWLALMRIQSTPLTVVSLLIGYLTVSNWIIKVIPLIVAGALGHWGFYMMNDVFDVDIDREQGKEDKPLVEGDISPSTALAVSIISIICSLGIAVVYFSLGAALAYIGAASMGMVYDLRSKTDTYSSFYLGAWGFFIILTGALYAGSVNIITILVASLLSFHMIWMTVMGDIRDVDSNEPNLVHKYDCQLGMTSVTHENYPGKTKLFKSIRFQMAVALPLLLIQYILALSITAIDIDTLASVSPFIVTLIVGYFFVQSGWTIGDNLPYTRDKTTKDIVKNEILALCMMLVVMFTFSPVLYIIMFGAGSIVWGLGWQIVQYREPLMFS